MRSCDAVATILGLVGVVRLPVVHGCSESLLMLKIRSWARCRSKMATATATAAHKQDLFRDRGSNRDETGLRSESGVRVDDRLASTCCCPKPAG
jgi:hypothetical protein